MMSADQRLSWPIALLLFAGASCASAPEAQRDSRGRVSGELAVRLGGVESDYADSSDVGGVQERVQTFLREPLTEETAVRIALLNNRDFHATMQELGVSAAEFVQAGLLSNPILAVNAKFFDDGTELEFGLTQSFLDVFFRPLRLRVAKAELAAAEAEVTAELIGMVFEVRRAVLELRLGSALVALHEDFLAAEDAALILTEELHRAGNVIDPMLTAAQVAHAAARVSLARQQQRLRELREGLNVQLGLWGQDVEWKLAEADESLEQLARRDLNLRDLETRAISASLALTHARADAEAAAQRAGLVDWEAWFPAFEAGVSGQREPATGEWGFGPEVVLGIPLLDPGRARSAASEAILLSRLNRFNQTAVEVRSAARTFRERWIGARDRAAFLEDEIVPLRARLVLETLQNFNGMQIGVCEVLLAKQDELEARRELVETATEALSARLDLEELLAGHFHHDRLEQGAMSHE